MEENTGNVGVSEGDGRQRVGSTAARRVAPLLVVSLCAASLACSATRGEDTAKGENPAPAQPGVAGDSALPGAPKEAGPAGLMDAGPEEAGLAGLMDAGPQEAGPAGLMDAGPQEAEPPAPPPTGGLSGTAWMPANSPEHVEPARAMPVSAALVQLTKNPVVAYPEAAYCNVCVKPEGFFAITDAKGLFMIDDVPEGDYVLTVQKGQFRRHREVTIVANQVVAAQTEWTTLPSNHEPENGDLIPRVAMVAGSYDKAQFVLAKLGIGVDNGGVWTPGTAMNRVDVFQGDGILAQNNQAGKLSELVANMEQLSQYHLILIPCGPVGVPEWIKQAKNLENLRSYVAAGGALFFTGWAGTYADALFPAQLEFLGGDTPPRAYDAAANVWNPELFSSVDRATLTLLRQPRTVDPDLTEWLLGQEALAPITLGLADDVHQEIVDASIWGGFMDTQIVNVNEVTQGLDASGMPIVDKPRVLVDAPTSDGGRAALAVSFRPAGCGRVMYSSYDLDGAGRPGSTPVERILMYSLTGLSVCEDAETPVVDQQPPPDKPPVPLPK